MKVGRLLIATATIPVLLADTTMASEAEFLKSLHGKWTGQGMVRLDIDSSPINVVCNVDSRATDTELLMTGRCKGLIVISRPVGADLKFNGAQYTGSYLRPTGGTAGLAGSRTGNAINLTIHWPNLVNGDRSADLTLQKLGNNGMRLVTVDVDPTSGDKVVISEIHLSRN
ncbi:MULTISPECIES: hypothetical protein [unclassified Sinorhizobium]|uniref:hypothetical protein n=1 Tax=unclassified Sinorhizobium TaxID=2613772 RepID=UPI0035234FFE